MEYHFLLLLIAFQAKHLIADYYLQFPYMYENKGKKYKTDWVKPLFDHSGVHAMGTLIIIGGFTGSVEFTFYAVLADFITHFITDRWKATRGVGPDKAWFWKSLGIDQLIHHSVGIITVYYAIMWVKV